MSQHRAVARPRRPPHHHGFCADRADDGAAEAAPRPHRLRHPRRRAGRVERLEGPAAPHALLRDGADPDRRLQRRVARRSGSPSARARSGARGSPTGRRRSASAILDLHYPAYWLRVDEDRQVRHAEFVRGADSEGLELRLRDPADGLRGGDRDHRPRPRPSAAAFGDRRRLRRLRRQHRRRADLHHRRRARARHGHRQPRLRQRRGRGAARQAHRQADRAGAGGARPARPRRSPASGRRAAGATPSRSSRR